MNSREILALLKKQEQTAIEAANRAAMAASRQMSDYRRPRVFFYRTPPNGSYTVFYASRFRSRPNDCFWIVVDAKTFATKLILNT